MSLTRTAMPLVSGLPRTVMVKRAVSMSGMMSRRVMCARGTCAAGVHRGHQLKELIAIDIRPRMYVPSWVCSSSSEVYTMHMLTSQTKVPGAHCACHNT